MKLVLEPRYLFDGSVAATGHHAFAGDHHHHHADGTPAMADAAHADHPHHTDLPTPPAIAEPQPALSGSPQTVLFVDPRVADWKALVSGVKPGVDVVVLDPNKNGIDQVSQALANLTNVRNVEFLTDGTAGSITLGGTTLDAATLGAYANQITGWSSHLAAHADIVFWGCDVGQGSVGAAFVADVHTLTGATVGASSDATGAAALGGDWTLEVATGPLHHNVNPFTQTTLAAYKDVLDTPAPLVALSVSDNGVSEGGTLNLGDTLVTTIALGNGAANATGYTPYVEVFAPGSLTLDGATENGVAVTDIAASVTNGSVINPLTHQTEAAPAGFTNGTMYVFELPDTSLAAGAALAPLVASFTMTSDASLVGQPLTITARGGFLNGAVAASGANIEGNSYSSTAIVIQPLDPAIAIVAVSNNTPTFFDPTGMNSGTAVSVVPGDIVRLRATDQLTTGVLPNTAVTMTVQLASGMTFTNDDTVSVMLVSGDGSASSTLSPTQVNDSSVAFNPAQTLGPAGADTTDPVVAKLSSSDYVYNSTTNTITFNLGNLSDGSSAGKFYVSVEFNATVGATVGTVAGGGVASLSASTTNTLTTATQTVQTPYTVTNFTDVLNLPLFNSSLGTLTSMALTVTGNEVTSGTFTTTSPVVGSMTFTVATKLSLAKDPSGPTLPTGSPSAISKATNSYTAVTVNQVIDFNPSPGESTADPATTTVSKTLTTGLSGFEAAGGGTVPIDVVGATSFIFSANGGNFTENTNSEAQAIVSVAYTYTESPAIGGNAFLNVQTPTISLTKTITGITYSGTTATVMYQDVVKNTGPVPLHGLTVTDPGTGDVNDTASYVGATGTGSTPGGRTSLNSLTLTLGSLSAGGTETYTYTETVPSTEVATTVADSGSGELATVTASALDPALMVSGKEVLTVGALTSTNTPPADISATAQAGLDSISGTVNQDTGVTEGGLNPLVPLSGETVAVTYTGQIGTESLTTDSKGNFTLLVPDGLSSVSIAATVGGVLASTVLDNHPDTTGSPSLPSASTTGFETSNAPVLTFNPVAGTSYSGIVFDFWQAPPSTLTPTLTIVGESNNTAGDGSVVDTASGNTVLFDPTGTVSPGVATTDGEIVRMRSTLAFTAGFADTTTMTVTLPSNLTFDANYATDNSVTVLLVDTSGTTTTTLGGTQLTPGTLNTAKLDFGSGSDTTDPVTTVLSSSDINVSGNTVTFSLGNLTNTAGTYYAVVEFNAVVNKAATSGTTLATTMVGEANSTSTATVTDYVTPQAPTVTLAKQITGVSYTGGTATVTYVDTVSNTGLVTAYGLALKDTGDGNTSDTLAFVSDAGTGTGASASVVSGSLQGTMTSLAAGKSETFTYTETVPTADVAASVTDSKTAQAAVTWYALNPAEFVPHPTPPATTGNEKLAGTVETPPTYNVTATAPFDAISGTVNQDTGPTEGGLSPLVALPGETVAVTYTGQVGTESVTTDSSGDFTFLVPDGLTSVSVAATVGGALTSAVLDNHPDTTGSPSLPSASTTGFETSNAPVLTFHPAAATNYSGIVFDFWAPSTLTPTLTVVGELNNTAGDGSAVDTASGNTVLFDPTGTVSPGVATTDGEIVRMRSTLQFTAGTADTTTMTVTLPSNLTFDANYATDNSVKVLLVDTSGTTTTTLGGTQLTPGTLNTAKLDFGSGSDTTDPVTTVLSSSDINVSGNTVTFNLGNLNNTAGTYYAVVEFNAVVNKAATSGTTLATTMVGDANSLPPTATVTDYVTPQAPTVTLAKQITGISYTGGTATVTYVDTVSNTGLVTAYGLSLADTGDGNTSDTLAFVSDAGTGTGASASVVSGSLQGTLSSLAAGKSETFTYTETVPVADVATSVTDSKTAQASVTWYALNPAEFVPHPTPPATTGNESLGGTVEAPPTYNVTATAPFDLVSGTVNQDLSPTEGTDTPLQALPGQAIAVTFTGQVGSETEATALDGSFSVLVPVGAGAVSIQATTSSPHAPPSDVLDNHPDTTGSPTLPSASTTGFETSNAPVLSFTPASGTSYSGVAFDFWATLDTPPVLAHGPSSPATYTSGGTGVTLFPVGTATDHELDTSFGSDFSGVTLTMQRYVSGVATPNANDVFTGSGTSTTGVFLDSGTHHVLLNGTEVGTYTESGGVLSITFLPAANSVSATTLDTVWNGIAYSYTGTVTTAITGVMIGTQIDDANNDPINLGSNPPDASGPHDQGPGSDLLSNVLLATVTIDPSPTLTPSISVIGGSNDTAGLGTLFDPNGQTSPGVLMTDGEIVRERATLQFTPGEADSTSMTVVLPSGLTLDPNYLTDGSVTVLLVSQNGDTTTSLSGAGLQLAEGGTPVDTSKLSLGTGTPDPVLVALPVGDISVSGQTVTFNLGNLTNVETGAPTYAIVEFNAIVSPTAAIGTVLPTSMTGTANSHTTAAVTDFVNPQAPTVTLTKVVGGITMNPDGSATVTYVDTITNTGPVIAYDPTLTDPGTGISGETASYTGIHSGPVVPTTAAASGSGFNATLPSLGGGASETFTYTVTIPPSLVANGVPDAPTTANVTDYALNPAKFSPANTGNEILTTTIEAPPIYTATAFAGLNAVSGTVNQDQSPTVGGLTPLVPLSGETVGLLYTGEVGTEIVTTTGTGTFAFLVPDTGVRITIATAATGTLATAVLDNHPDQASSLVGTTPSTVGFLQTPAALQFTPATGHSYSGLAFDFWTAPPQQQQQQPPLPPIVAANPVTPNHSVDEPLIPQLALIGSPASYFIITDVQSTVELPGGMFEDSDPSAILTFEAAGPGGAPLPPWLTFDPNTLQFKGVAPVGAVGVHDIIITATDQYGNQAQAEFTIRVGHPPGDLSKLLQQLFSEQPSGFLPFGINLGALSPTAPLDHVHPTNVADAAAAKHHPAAHRDVADHAGPYNGHLARTTTVASRSTDLGGFTAELRAAGRMGALARARALLDGLSAVGQEHRPG